MIYRLYNSFRSSIGVAPYKALYGRKCRSHICWDIEGLRQLEGPELVQETEDKIQTVQKCLKAAKDQQKRTNKHHRKMEYEVGEKVFLKVSPWRGILRFSKQEKLSQRYSGPYEILERLGLLAYRLALPTELSQIHDVFHVSMLRQYRSDPNHILREPEIEISEDFTYVEQSNRNFGPERPTTRLLDHHNRAYPVLHCPQGVDVADGSHLAQSPVPRPPASPPVPDDDDDDDEQATDGEA
ncbi:hypothetical protein Sango_2079000 [Sesamum angolense]|uniref:Tf2-1-like SH3-like domain-containing protein n=1 Tax=Sesamum angolense TaxID=2727404 RepID=A0AAE1WB61_9LAMI|nr:hypothetical protein Sango_2079000 [Sesamum angolense]